MSCLGLGGIGGRSVLVGGAHTLLVPPPQPLYLSCFQLAGLLNWKHFKLLLKLLSCIMS